MGFELKVRADSPYVFEDDERRLLKLWRERNWGVLLMMISVEMGKDERLYSDDAQPAPDATDGEA